MNITRFLLFIFICVSCGQQNFIEVKDESGLLKQKYQTNKEGVKHGVAFEYFDTGELQIEENYKNGILHGPRKILFKNGNTEIEEMYEEGVIKGDYRVFYENGQLNIKANYKEGKMEGMLIRYFESGSIMEEVNMKDNEENGPFKEYYENGQVQWEGVYLNGENEFGELKQYDEKGTLIKKMMCDSFAVCQTIWDIERGDITPQKIDITHEKK